jgi:hypothetical protein
VSMSVAFIALPPLSMIPQSDHLDKVVCQHQAPSAKSASDCTRPNGGCTRIIGTPCPGGARTVVDCASAQCRNCRVEASRHPALSSWVATVEDPALIVIGPSTAILA